MVWYQTQHEHWIGWLGAYDGPGAYNRKNANRSAEYVYNHIVNPRMLVYLAEAAKVDRKLLAKATKAALLNRVSMSAMSAAIRRLIPWPLVEKALIGDTTPPQAAHRTQQRCSPSPRPTRSPIPERKKSQPLRILHLNLRREFFAQIAAKIKCIEYRDRTPYWQKRLEGREYDVIQFRNGYATKAPEMQVEFLGVKKIHKQGEPYYAIQLGQILTLKRWKP